MNIENEKLNNNEHKVKVTKLLNQSKLNVYKCQLIQLNNQMAMNTTVCIDELLILKWQAEFLCAEEWDIHMYIRKLNWALVTCISVCHVQSEFVQ